MSLWLSHVNYFIAVFIHSRRFLCSRHSSHTLTLLLDSDSFYLSINLLWFYVFVLFVFFRLEA